MEKLWTERMENEGKIMLNKYETLNSTVERLGSEIINLRDSKIGSAASTVSASSGSGGSARNFVASVISSAFTPTWVSLRGWSVWRNIRGTGITMDEARTLVSEMKTQNF